jgi:hypothetical protein
LYIEQQQIPRPVDNNKRKMYYSLGKKKKRYTIVKNQIMVNNRRGYILHNMAIRKEKDMIIISIRITTLSSLNKLLMRLI